MNLARLMRHENKKLIAMSAPLVREMATPLRRSANTLEIFQEQIHSKDNFLYLDKKMAEEINSI